MSDTAIRVEVWSDIVCPWCYLGRRRLDQALEEFEHADLVQVTWRSFQLDPSYPKGTSQPMPEVVAAKMNASPTQARAMTDRLTTLAAEAGLAYDLEHARVVNTFDGHRLSQLAATHGLGSEMTERLHHAQFVEARDLSDQDTLVELAASVGVPAAEAREVLAGDAYADDVAEDIAEASRLGITGVPFFVLDRRYGVSGAQPAEALVPALRKAYEDHHAAV